MFIKLRNRFLMLNMVIISVMMLAAFVVIYITTQSNVRLENQNKINSSAVVIMTDTTPTDGMEYRTSASHQYGSFGTFSITVDEAGEILQVDSVFDIPYEAYQSAAEAAWKNNTGTIAIENRKWQYSMSRVGGASIVLGNGLPSAVEENSYRIVFLDITESSDTLFQLLTTLVIVGAVLLVVIFFISLYFANRAITPIAEAWEKQKRFIADASHELRTPLTIINTNYDAILANPEETIESQRKWFDYMKIGMDRMAKLISDMLALAKIEGVAGKISKKPFDLSAAIHEVLLSMEAAAHEKCLTVHQSIQPGIVINSDAEMVRQVFSILYDNAIKYSNANGQIDVTLVKSKNKIVCAVKNSGAGIAKQDLPNIFVRFYRADPSRTGEAGGCGLGLSIAKTIVDSLDGQIQADSVENEYTVFTVAFSRASL